MCGENMTGTAFLKRLRFQLDFLNAEDQEVVLSFYENKISQAITLTEEEEIVKGFGSPEAIAEKLKALYIKHQQEEMSEQTSDSEKELSAQDFSTANDEVSPSEEVIDPTADDAEEDKESNKEKEEIENDAASAEKEATSQADSESKETEDNDLIFSRPDFTEHSSEVLHAIEFDDVKPIYGEKVVIRKNESAPIEIDFEEDDHNGFTTVEIELAKAETLKKAKDYNSGSIRTIEAIEEDEESAAEEEKQNESLQEDTSVLEDTVPQEKTIYKGLFNRPFENKETSKSRILFCKALFTILLSPVLLIALLSVTVIYGVISAICIFISVLLFALTLGIIILGIIELVYGITLLFDTVSVALIEIGLGTALFGLVTALSAFIYQFLFGTIPGVLKNITKRFKKLLKTILCYFYGGSV